MKAGRISEVSKCFLKGRLYVVALQHLVVLWIRVRRLRTRDRVFGHHYKFYFESSFTLSLTGFGFSILTGLHPPTSSS